MAASTALGTAGLYGAGYGGMAGAGGLAGLGGIGMLYSTSFLYAGFVGLGALWAALYFGGYNGQGGGGGYGGGGYGGYGGHGGYGGYGGYRGGGGYGGYGGGGGYGGYRGGYGNDYGGSYNSYKGTSHFKNKGVKGHDKGHVKGYDKGHVKGHVHSNDCHHKRKRRSTDQKIWAKDHWVPQETRHTFISQNVLDEMNLQSARTNPRKVVEQVHSSLQSVRDSRNFWEIASKDPEEERLLRAIRQSDTDNCGLRLVCELAAIRDRPLTVEEWEILRFVRQGDDLYNKVYPGQGIGPNSSVLRDYKEAEHFGNKGGACAERFKRCRVSAAYMMTTITGLRRL